MSELAHKHESPLATINPLEALLSNPAALQELPVEKMERLLAMYERHEEKAAERALSEAISAFQAECPVITKKHPVKDKHGQVLYKFAKLEDAAAQVQPLLTKHGLSYSFNTEDAEHGVTVYCIVKHVDGGTAVSQCYMPRADIRNASAAQSTGGTITYGKRHAFLDAFGILTADEDNDAAATARVQDWLEEYNLFCRDNWDLIHGLKTAIANGDTDGLIGLLVDATEDDNANGRVNQERTLSRIVRVAPTKGGWLTVEEKSAIVCDETAAAVREALA